MLQITQKILDIVVELYPSLGKIPVSLDTPPKNELWDYAFNVFALAKPLGKNPTDVANEIAAALNTHGNPFRDATVMGWYVNFFLVESAWVGILQSCSIEAKPANNETVVVDYIGANAGKPLHIGHLCTPSVGQTIINTHEYLGYTVIGDSHFGDWGGIFGKLIYSWRYLFSDIWKEEYSKFEVDYEVRLENKETSRDRASEEYENFKNELINKKWADWLLSLYQFFHIYEWLFSDNEKIDMEIREEGARKEFQFLSWIGIDLTDEEQKKHHEENAELWQKFTAISIAEVNKKLELINVKPQYNIGESFYEGLNLPRPNNEDYPDLEWNMKDIVRELIEKKIATQNEDGSVGVIFPEETKIPSCVLQKKDGTGLYLTSDLAAIKYRLHNWHPSKIVYSVDVRQQLHLRQCFWIAKQAWPELANTELFHAFNGFIKLKEGAMSTRKWTVIFLSDLISEGFSRTKQILEEKGQSLSDTDIQAIAIGAIKYSYLAQDREKDVVFDWDKALALEGNSGPYIQYAYVRAKNIAEKAGSIENLKVEIDNLSLSTYDRACLRRLAAFDRAVLDTATKYKPHILATYCYELAVELNAFYAHTPKVLEETNVDLRTFRLALIVKVRDTLEKGFELLGINMPEKM